MPWQIAELPKLPAASVLDRFESEGWTIHQIIGPHPESGKVYLYLRRSVLTSKTLPADADGVIQPRRLGRRRGNAN